LAPTDDLWRQDSAMKHPETRWKPFFHKQTKQTTALKAPKALFTTYLHLFALYQENEFRTVKFGIFSMKSTTYSDFNIRITG
jgi:hypothetical protein